MSDFQEYPFAIETFDLKKTYGKVKAVDGLNFQVPKGSIFGLVGANGAGKTTTMRMLLDLIRPTSGTMKVLGQEPRRGGAKLRSQIGYLPGELHLDDRFSGLKLLDYLAQISGPTKESTVTSLADKLQLDLSRPVGKLSKGNKQKLGIIQAFMHQPALLILDEPTSGLDPIIQRIFLDLAEEATQNGQTVLLSSHVLSEIQHSADQVLVLSQGKIAAQGDVASLRLASLRQVEISTTFIDIGPLEAALRDLPGIKDLKFKQRPSGMQTSFTFQGDPNHLISALGKINIEDVLMIEPSLEDSILSLYQTDSQPKHSKEGTQK